MNVTFLLNFYYMFNLSLKITMTAKRFSTDDRSNIFEMHYRKNIFLMNYRCDKGPSKRQGREKLVTHSVCSPSRKSLVKGERFIGVKMKRNQS